MENTEKTLKKMAIVIDRMAKKIDEIDERVQKLEMSSLSQRSGETEGKNTTEKSEHSLKSGFLGSLLGSFAGMSLFSILTDNRISPEDIAKDTDGSEIELNEMEQKLEEISNKVEDIEEKLETENVAMEDELPEVEPNMEYFETDFGLDNDEWIA